MAEPIQVPFDELPARVGTELGVSNWLEVTQPMIDRFGEVTRDQAWIHVDPARAARESPYRVPIAHGFLTMSLLSHLLQDALQVDRTFGINTGFDRVRMTDAVPVGARIRAHFVLAELAPVNGGYRLGWDVTIEREGSSKPALVARWLVRLMRA